MTHKFTRTTVAFAAAGALAGALLLSGFTTRDDRDTRDTRDARPASARCLDSQHIGRKHVVDDHTLLVYDDWGNAFKLDIGGPCRNMDDWDHIGFEFNGTSDICGAHDAMILYSKFDEQPLRCVINGVHPVSKTEAAELDK